MEFTNSFQVLTSLIDISDGANHVTQLSYEKATRLKKWYKMVLPRNLTMVYKDGVLTVAGGLLEETGYYNRYSHSWIKSQSWKCVNLILTDNEATKIEYFKSSLFYGSQWRDNYYVIITKSSSYAILPSVYLFLLPGFCCVLWFLS